MPTGRQRGIKLSAPSKKRTTKKLAPPSKGGRGAHPTPAPSPLRRQSREPGARNLPGRTTRRGRLNALLARGQLSAVREARHKLPGEHAGLLSPGNLDLERHPVVTHKGATGHSLAVKLPDGRAVLIPGMVKGKKVSDKQAVHHFLNTGQHLGIFANTHSAADYAVSLHHWDRVKHMQAAPESYGAPITSQETLKFAARPKGMSDPAKPISQGQVLSPEALARAKRSGISKREIRAGVPIPESVAEPWGPGKIVGDFARVAAGFGPGLVYHAIDTYHHPIGAQERLGKGIASSLKESVTHPIRQYQRPGGAAELLMNVTLPLFGAAGAARRLGAVSEIRAGTAPAEQIAKFEKEGYPPETLRKMEKGVPLHEALPPVPGQGRAIARAILRPPPVTREITYKGQTVHPAAVKSALGGYMQKVGDYVLQKHLNNPDNMVSKFLTSTLGHRGGLLKPETRFARMMRREYRIKQEVRGGLATVLTSPKLGPSLPAQLHNVFTREDISAIRKGKRAKRLTHEEQAGYAERAADTVAIARGYTSHERHHDLWEMGEPMSWWTAHSHEFERGHMVPVKKPPDTYDINPNHFRTESQYARHFEQMFPGKKQLLANPGAYRYVPSEIVDGLMPYKPGRGTAETWATNIDRMTQGIRAGRFLHPGYAQWAVQNGILHLTQAGMHLFRNAYLLRHEYSKVWELRPDLAGGMEQASGAGIAQATTGEIGRILEEHPGAFRKLDRVLEKLRHKGERFWHHLDDRPWRLMALIHELERAGHHGSDAWIRLFHGAIVDDNPAAWKELIPIIERSRKEAIDYSEMTPAERGSARRVFTAYGWTRGASTWTFRYPFQHPIQARVYGQLGEQGANKIDDTYAKAGGMVPEWLRGTAPITAGDSPLGFETELLSPPETPARMWEAMPGFGRGTENLLSEVAPGPGFIWELLSGQTRYGRKFQGKEKLTGPIKDALRRFEPIGAFAQVGKESGTSSIKGGKLTALERYLGVPLARIRDIHKTAALGERDFEESLSKPQQIDFRHAKALQRLPLELQDLHKRGIDIPESLVGQYKGDLDAIKERDHFQLDYAKKHGFRNFRELPAINKFEGALAFLHQYRHLSTAEANHYRTAATIATDDKQLESVASALWASSGIGATASAWKSINKSIKPAHLTPPGG